VNELMIFEKNEQVLVSSRAVAERFHKMHKNVLTSVRDIIGGLLRNEHTPMTFFMESVYQDSQNGEFYPEFFMNRDGFTLLAMGFTGDEALTWKVKYIQTFNAMEALIRERLSTDWLVTRKQGKLVRRNETDMIAELIPYAEEQGSKNMRQTAYMTYTKLVNSLVGIESGERDFVSCKTLTTIIFLEDMIHHTIAEEMANGTFYKEIYRKCKENEQQIIRFAYLPGLSLTA